MNSQILWIFQQEVRFQCRAFESALVMFEKAVAKQMAATRRTASISVEEETGETFIALQGMLVAAANLSKLLWGSEGPELEKEREPLRDSLGVRDTSCLRDRKLRNDFEHFDERVDKWFSKGRRSYAGRNIGPIKEFNFDPKDRFHHYDPDTGIVTFWDHSVSVLDLGREVVDIYHKAEDALRHFPLN